MITVRNLLATLLFAASALSATAQDLMAKQTPVDKSLTTLSTVAIGSTLEAIPADLENPAAHIYSNWEYKNLRNAKGWLPSGSKVDLRGYVMPTDSRKITSKFGWRWRRQHEGIDIKVYIGDTIRAAFDGRVRICQYNARGYGYYVVIRHPNGLETLYGHLSRQLVQPDQIVRAGDPIGLGGNTGRSTGSHLHFETRICGTPINPALMFDFENQDIVSDYFVTRQNYGERSAVGNSTAYIDVAATTESPAVDTTPAQQSTNKAAASASRRTYTVKKGDTLSAIAKRNGTTVKRICQVNGISANKTIRPGQKLKL